jgi:hypothetical protein
MIYTILNVGPNPRGVRDMNNIVKTLRIGETGKFDLTVNAARKIARQDGPLRLQLTEEQACDLNEPDPVVEIPADWKKLLLAERRLIASTIASAKITRATECAGVIEGELRRRNGA